MGRLFGYRHGHSLQLYASGVPQEREPFGMSDDRSAPCRGRPVFTVWRYGRRTRHRAGGPRSRERSFSLAFYCPGVVVLSSSVRMNGAGRVGWLLWPSTSTLPSKVTRPVAVASRRFVVLVLIRKP